jgi:hypothetical protein
MSSTVGRSVKTCKYESSQCGGTFGEFVYVLHRSEMISCYSPCCSEQADNQRLRKAILTFFLSIFLLARPISFTESEKRPREFREKVFIRTCGGWPHAAAVDCSPLCPFFIFPLATGFVLYSIFCFLGIYLISESFVVDGYCPLEDDTRRCIFLGCYLYFPS